MRVPPNVPFPLRPPPRNPLPNIRFVPPSVPTPVILPRLPALETRSSARVLGVQVAKVLLEGGDMSGLVSVVGVLIVGIGGGWGVGDVLKGYWTGRRGGRQRGGCTSSAT
jgi:hypothetical protein